MQGRLVGFDLSDQVYTTGSRIYDHRAVRKALGYHETCGANGVGATSFSTCRSRDETRMVEVFAPGNSLADTEWDGRVSAVIRVNRDVLTGSAITGLWRSTSEMALFVSGVVLPAAQCTKAIRDHWSIENPHTTFATVASQKTPAASVAIRASLHACARLPPTSCASTAFAMSQTDAIASPLAASARSSVCVSCIER